MAVIDKGHNNLVEDLSQLLKEAEEFEFHDFLNPTLSAPKSELAGRLRALIDNVIEGRYDNQDTGE